MGLRGRLRSGCLGATIACALLAFAFAGSAGAYGTRDELMVQTTSDAEALAHGVKVAVDSPNTWATIVVKSARDGPRLTQKHRVMGRGHFSLPLSQAGEEVLNACGAKRLTVRAVSDQGRHLARTSTPIERTVPQCK